MLVGSSHLTSTGTVITVPGLRLILSLAVPLVTFPNQDFGGRSFYSLFKLLTLKVIKHTILVSIDYGSRVLREVLKPNEFYSINCHASLLPRWTGAAPTHRALEHFNFELGVSIIRMDVHIDAGPIFYRKSIVSSKLIWQIPLVHTVSLIITNALSALFHRMVGRKLRCSEVFASRIRRTKHKHRAAKVRETFIFNPLKILVFRTIKILVELSRTTTVFNIMSTDSINLRVGGWNIVTAYEQYWFHTETRV